MATQDIQNENAIDNTRDAPGHFLRFCCAITFTDITVLRECNSHAAEKTIVLRAISGIILLLVIIPSWILLLQSMLKFPLWGAIFAGCLIGMVMFLLDTAITRGDWELKGILAESGLIAVCSRLFRALPKAMLRLPIALNFSILMGTFVTMTLFSDSLENQIEKNRQQHNASIEAKYQVAREKLYEDLIAPAQDGYKALAQARQTLFNQLNQRRLDQQAKEDAVSRARIAKEREIESGAGPRFRHAELKEEEALRHIALLQQEVARDDAQLVALEGQLKDIDAQKQAAQTRFANENAQLIAERDAKLLPTRSDVLMRLQALHQLMEDDRYGEIVTFGTYSIEFFLITIEMIIFIAVFLEPPSPYTVALRERTRTQARQLRFKAVP